MYDTITVHLQVYKCSIRQTDDLNVTTFCQCFYVLVGWQKGLMEGRLV